VGLQERLRGTFQWGELHEDHGSDRKTPAPDNECRRAGRHWRIAFSLTARGRGEDQRGANRRLVQNPPSRFAAGVATLLDGSRSSGQRCGSAWRGFWRAEAGAGFRRRAAKKGPAPTAGSDANIPVNASAWARRTNRTNAVEQKGSSGGGSRSYLLSHGLGPRPFSFGRTGLSSGAGVTAIEWLRPLTGWFLKLEKTKKDANPSGSIKGRAGAHHESRRRRPTGRLPSPAAPIGRRRLPAIRGLRTRPWVGGARGLSHPCLGCWPGQDGRARKVLHAKGHGRRGVVTRARTWAKGGIRIHYSGTSPRRCNAGGASPVPFTSTVAPIRGQSAGGPRRRRPGPENLSQMNGEDPMRSWFGRMAWVWRQAARGLAASCAQGRAPRDRP